MDQKLFCLYLLLLIILSGCKEHWIIIGDSNMAQPITQTHLGLRGIHVSNLSSPGMNLRDIGPLPEAANHIYGSKVIISLGTNDAIRGEENYSANEFRARYRDLIRRLRTNGALTTYDYKAHLHDAYDEREIYCIDILPDKVNGKQQRFDEFRQIVREECPNIIAYTRFNELSNHMTDSVHYTDHGYERLAHLLYEALSEES